MNPYRLGLMLLLNMVLVISTVSPLYAQFVVKGKIIDTQTQEPLVGAAVQVVGSTQGAIADSQGAFTLHANQKIEKIAISMIGFGRQEVAVQEGRPLLVALEPAIEDLQTVVITGNREAALRTETPMAISKLSPKLIDETKPTSLYEVINKTPGVMMVNLNNEQHSMAIRQPFTTNSYYLYMEDGVPIRPMGVFNHNALLEMNQFTVSSVEVVKGPVSSIYGPEAVGGAINFITQRPTALPTARVGVQCDQWGYQRIQYGAGITLGRFGMYLGGFVAKQRGSWMTSSDYDKNAQFARLEYHFTDRTRLVGTVSYANYNSQTSGSVDSVAFYARQYVSTTGFTYRKSYSVRSRLTLEHDWANGSQSFLTVFARDNQHGQNPSYGIRWVSGSNTATGEINSSDFRSVGVITQHSQRFKFLNAKWINGAVLDLSPSKYWSYRIDLAAQLRADKKSVERYTITTERPDIQLANYDADIHNSALYSQFDFEPIRLLRLSVGIRYDNMSFGYNNYLDKTSGTKSYRQVTPKIGITYDLGQSKGLYANYSKGFSPPGLTAIFRKRTTPTASGELFYYNLEPAQFDNAEVGGWASLLHNKLYLDVAVYQMNGTNELLNIRLADNSFDYRSAGKTLHRGLEFGLTYKPNKSVFVRLGGTTAVHRYQAFVLSEKATDALKNVNGKDMPSSPRWLWNAEVSYYPNWAKNLRTSLEWQHVDGWYQNQINTIRYKGYDLLNARAGYQWKGIEMFVNVLNIADALYATNATRGNNATDRTTFTPAAPRTFTLGLQYNFAGKQ